jgi:hypothetical protein
MSIRRMVSEFCSLRPILAVEEQQMQLISRAQEMCCQFLQHKSENKIGEQHWFLDISSNVSTLLIYRTYHTVQAEL